MKARMFGATGSATPMPAAASSSRNSDVLRAEHASAMARPIA